jgi:hypothetical protein
MASDITKWSDHALILSKHSVGLLAALYSVKKQLDLEGGISDLLQRGGMSELSIYCRGIIIVPESPARPPATRLSLFIDPAVSNIQKQIIKKFPEGGGDVGKATVAILAQATELIVDLKPYYDLFSAVAEYLEMCLPVLIAIQKLKLTVYGSNVDGELSRNFDVVL